MENKILILLPYYERPTLVRNALNSIKNSTYTNWELAFIDDGIKYPGTPIVEEILHGHMDKVNVHESKDTAEMKEAQGGSRMGHYMNLAIESSDADIVIMLCDDDALEEKYLENLNKWFTEHPDLSYCYSHIIKFNPEIEKFPLDMTKDRSWMLNRHITPINPNCQVDASQVAWKLEVHKKYGIDFPSPLTAALDAHLYTQLFHNLGTCRFTGFKSQYKAVFNNQLGARMAQGKTWNTGDKI